MDVIPGEPRTHPDYDEVEDRIISRKDRALVGDSAESGTVAASADLSRESGDIGTEEQRSSEGPEASALSSQDGVGTAEAYGDDFDADDTANQNASEVKSAIDEAQQAGQYDRIEAIKAAEEKGQNRSTVISRADSALENRD